MEYCSPSQLFFNPEIFPVAEPATKAVTLAGRFVVGLSSSFDGNQLRKRCSGFWIDWEKENKTGIVLTSTHLFSSEGCSVEKRGEEVEEEYAPRGKVKYYPHAKVTVHLMDGSATVGHLVYYQEHYDLAFFRVKVDQSVQLPSYNDEVKWGQLAFWLGRDAKSNLTMTHLRPGYKRWIPRPHLGLLFSCIKLLDFVQVEKIRLNYKIDDGLIVNEVLKGSQAEEIGIRRGDIIESFNGECISTTVQLENLLLSLCKSAERGLDSKIHVSFGVFHVRKRRRKTREFKVGVSQSLEVIERVYKLVTLEEGTCAASAST